MPRINFNSSRRWQTKSITVKCVAEHSRRIIHVPRSTTTAASSLAARRVQGEIQGGEAMLPGRTL